MVSAGKLNSEEVKIAELKAKIRPGSIIYLFCDFISNPKLKYILIAAIDFENDASLVFLINSEIPRFIQHDDHLKTGQILLSKDPNYTFFDHDSYINCIEVFDCLDLDFALSHLIANPGDYKGELRREEKDKVISFVRIAQTIPKIDQDKIIKSLSG